MFVPFISTPSFERRRGLWRRQTKGRGGGGGGGQDDEEEESGTGTSGNSGSGSDAYTPERFGIRAGGKSYRASTSSDGTTNTTTIPEGVRFEGRKLGGATRSQIYGTRAYGSGYPGVTGKGTAGRDFPFFFWPVTFGAEGSPSYLYVNEYSSKPSGQFNSSADSLRPGLGLSTALITPKNSSSNQSNFRILADSKTIEFLRLPILEECGLISEPAVVELELYEVADAALPKPEQVVQYYRASSVALALDGYNNTAAFTEDESVPDTPLPTGVDLELLACLNTTIGESALLADFEPLEVKDMSFGVRAEPGGLVGVVLLLSAICSMFS